MTDAVDEPESPAPSGPEDETVDLGSPAEEAGLRTRLRQRLRRHEHEREREEAAGPELGQRYRPLRELGRGGMGAVWEVEDTQLGRRVAVKTALSDDRALVARFRREARLAAQLEHPNIVPVYDSEDGADGSVSLTMRLVEGRSLRAELEDAVRGAKELGQARVLEVVVAVGQALSYAHAQGIIHRDIKPANVMLGRFGQVFLTDFGLAKRIGERDDPSAATSGAVGESVVSQEGLVVGTPAYMAPEQAAGHVAEVDAQTDVYALGALLYELLTLTRPFTGAKGQGLLDAIQSEAPQDPRKRAPARAIPPELAAIALKALTKSKTGRYASVEALLEDVRAFQEGRAVSAFREPLRLRLRKWARRHSLLVATALTGLIVASLAGASLAVYRGRVQADELARLQRRERATVPYLTGMDLLRRRLDVATISSQALPALQEAIAIDPEFAEARFALGQAYLRCFDVERALEAMQRALEQQPRNAHWLVQVGRVYQHRVSPRHPEAASYRERARDYYARAAGVGSGASPFAAIGQALVANEDGRPAEARELLGSLTEAAPHLWEAWHALGYVTLPDDPAAAEAAFRRALALEPDEGSAVRGVAAALLGQERYEEALEYSQRAAELSDPAESLDVVNLGHVLFRLGRFEAVLPVLREALAREPTNCMAHMTLGASYQGLGRTEEALASFSAAIECDDGSVGGDAYEGRGSVLINSGHPEEALADFEVALERSPEAAQNWANRAFARMQLGQLEGARADLDEALRRDPTLGSAWANLAGVREALGDKAGAVEALNRGIEGEPGNGQLWLFRAQFRLEAGRPAEAIADLERALELGGAGGQPLPPEAVILLLRAYRRTGQHEQVLATIEAHGAKVPARLRRLLDGEGGLAHFAVAQALCAKRDYLAALPHLRRSNELEPQTSNAFLAAEVAAQVGELDEAVAFLEAWRERGGRDPRELLKPSLAPLREHPGFQALREALGGAR